MLRYGFFCQQKLRGTPEELVFSQASHHAADAHSKPGRLHVLANRCGTAEKAHFPEKYLSEPWSCTAYIRKLT